MILYRSVQLSLLPENAFQPSESEKKSIMITSKVVIIRVIVHQIVKLVENAPKQKAQGHVSEKMDVFVYINVKVHQRILLNV
jgi:hypothetical protein